MTQSKNVIWWTAINNPDHQEKYGGYDYFEYSRKTWKFWCKRNNVEFVEFTEPREKDLKQFNPNWQKCIFVFDELEDRNIQYNKIALVDSTAMIKWNAPNFFELTDDRFTAWKDTDNLKWVYDSMVGYKDFYKYDCDILKYFNSGFIIFNESHKKYFNSLRDHYYDNKEKYIELQSSIVKKGNDQTPLNYWMQMNNVEMNLDLPIAFNLTHMHRKEMFIHNWQLDEDKTPHYIKHGYVWRFNGIPKNERTRAMEHTWNQVKDNYNDRYANIDGVLSEIDHKDTAKYTTSKKFKKDILDTFYNDKYKNSVLLELGTSQGQSTRMLSHIFKHVYTVEWNDWNIEQAKKRCEGRDNITFIKADLYNSDWEVPKADIVFIDAGHEYHQVISDINKTIKHLNNPIFIFDDYGLPPGEVRKAILEKVAAGELRLNKFIGERPEDLVHAAGTKFIDIEGCICNLR